jgi:hypothetical protein
MLHLLLRAAIAAPVVAYLVPFFATSRLRAAGTAANTTRADKRKRRAGCSPELQREWAAHEFAFGCAIEGYEELIDKTAGRLS